jgi:hypothetical protein
VNLRLGSTSNTISFLFHLHHQKKTGHSCSHSRAIFQEKNIIALNSLLTGTGTTSGKWMETTTPNLNLASLHHKNLKFVSVFVVSQATGARQQGSQSIPKIGSYY